MKTYIGIWFLLLAYLTPEILGLSCYTCTLEDDKNCGDKYKPNPDHVKTCKTKKDSEVPVCIKTKVDSPIAKSLVRGCGISTGVGNFCKAGGSSGMGGAVCQCTGNKCNSASTPGKQIVLYITLAGLLLFYK